MLIKKTNAVYNPDLKAKLNANKDTATKKKKKNTGTEKWAELIEMARKKKEMEALARGERGLFIVNRVHQGTKKKTLVACGALNL